MSYASIQAIREGAGLLQRDVNAKPKGTIDGSNRVFVVPRRPIVDRDYDDEVTTDDVTAYVDGIPVNVSDVDATTGKITLKTAPASGVVTVDYCFSPITDDYTAGKQQEADSWVDLKIKAYIKTPVDPVPGIIATATEMYAAGLILTRDWGSRVDSELTSKDGFNKIKQARDLIADYIQGLKDDNATKGDANGKNSGATVITDQDVFGRCYEEDTAPRGGSTDDDFFMRRQ